MKSGFQILKIIKKKQSIYPKEFTPSVEIRIPISATKKYLRMIHYFLESLKQFGGPIGSSAKCVILVGRDEPFRDLTKEFTWISNYDIKFLWTDEDLFKKYNYHGTSFSRLKIKSEADIIILADADILVANDFDQAILDSFINQKLLGCIAHVSPFIGLDSKNTSSKIWWRRIFDEAGICLPLFNNIHTGWGLMNKDEEHRRCPNYYNYGFIISPRKYIEQMSQDFLSELEAIDHVLKTHFKSQIANTLSFERNNIPCGTLPINYNFPLHVSDEKIRALNLDPKGENSAEHVKIFHYLGNGRFNKKIFETSKSLENILEYENLNEAETVFQRKLRFIHKRIESKQ